MNKLNIKFTVELSGISLAAAHAAVCAMIAARKGYALEYDEFDTGLDSARGELAHGLLMTRIAGQTSPPAEWPETLDNNKEAA